MMKAKCWMVRGAVWVALGSAITGVSTPAHALFGSSGRCDRTDDDRAQASRVIRNIAGRLDAMETKIVETLRLHAGQVTGYQAQSTKAIVQALDSKTKLEAQIAREVEESRIVRQRRPTRRGCRTATGVRGMAAVRQAAEEEKKRADIAGIGRIVGDRSVVAGSGADDSQRFEALMRRYCSRARLGEDAGACGGSDEMHGADMRPGNLFDRSTLVSDEERRTAIEVSRNLAAPVVNDPLPIGSAETSQERRRVLLSRSAATRSALASDFFAHARTLRAPGADLGRWAAVLVPGRDAGRPLSRYELLEILAAKRFENPDWFIGLQAMNESNLLRELVALKAVELMLSWESYRLDERRGGIAAARLAMGAEEMRRLPGLGPTAGSVN